MKSLTTGEASQRLDELLDHLADSHEAIHISGHRHSAVLVSEEDWQMLQDSIYLGSVSGVAESLVKGLRVPLEKCSTQPEQ